MQLRASKLSNNVIFNIISRNLLFSLQRSGGCRVRSEDGKLRANKTRNECEARDKAFGRNDLMTIAYRENGYRFSCTIKSVPTFTAYSLHSVITNLVRVLDIWAENMNVTMWLRLPGKGNRFDKANMRGACVVCIDCNYPLTGLAEAWNA